MVGHEVFISQMKDQIRIFQKQNRRIMTYFLWRNKFGWG